ncbi:MAG: hypothetical protein KF799_05275 [Bdellovibrionales bacterium]|nr:hypothetical protein [Bdellovibrionales bacterium]
MKTLSLVLLFAFLPLSAQADLTIFDVRRTLRMANTDPIYHDYYINGGNESGLSNGMILTVTRKLPLYDNYQNHSAGDLNLKVAKLKIIHVQKGLAVGRLQSEFTRENAPLLEDAFIMVGDSLDLSTATHDGKKGTAADASSSGGGTEASTPEAAKPVAQITVNSVELSSQSAPTPAPVDTPTLQ